MAMVIRQDSVITEYESSIDCCSGENDPPTTSEHPETSQDIVIEMQSAPTSSASGDEQKGEDTIDGRVGGGGRSRVHQCGENKNNNWAEHKNVAEGLMDIALLSANANQLRFLITYNNRASTYFISLGLIALSLALQVAVGIALIFKRRIRRNRTKRTQTRINEFLVGGVFMVTVVNVLLAAFTTTDNDSGGGGL